MLRVCVCFLTFFVVVIIIIMMGQDIIHQRSTRRLLTLFRPGNTVFY